MHRILVVLGLAIAPSLIAQDISMPAFNNTFTASLTRGFWFQCPIGAVITGIEVYNEANQPNQVVEVIDLNGAPPPSWPGTATGTQLFYDNTTPAGTMIAISPGVPLVPGEYYGILAACTSSPTGSTSYNSYSVSPGPFSETFLGSPVTLTRFGTQTGIGANGGVGVTNPVWQEPSGPIARADVYLMTATGFAIKETFGDGCNEEYTSFYENFASGAHDLSNSDMTMLYTGFGYIVVGGASTFQPTTAATALNLSSNGQIIKTLTSGTIATPTGPTSQLVVCSNGFISVATGNGTGSTPNVNTFLDAPQTAWWCWHNYNPSLTGSGQVMWEETATHVYVTWDNVFSVSNGPGNTFQFQFDKAAGHVGVVWQTINSTGNGHLVGYSPGGTSLDPGQTDLSVAIPNTIMVGLDDVVPLSFDGSARPVIGTNITLDIAEIPTGSPLAAVVAGLTEYTAGQSLAGLGMPDCFQYVSTDATLALVPTGPTAQVPYTIPNDPGLAGVILVMQSAAFAPGANPLGVLTSNGLRLTLEVN